jgi:adenylate cyclase
MTEIEKKYTVRQLPDLTACAFHIIEQAYLNTNPVVRIRKEDDSYYLTYKGKGMLAREEYNLPLTKESYYHLLEKADGNIISKKRYLIPFDSHTIELDIFHDPFTPLIIAEVEFDSEEDAASFIPPDWFLEDVTFDREYHNSTLSTKVFQ